MREKKRNALLHAEIVAIDRACKRLGAWRLEGCDIYVTLEPCPMCMGAILNARLDSVYFGAYDAKAGACGSVIDLNAYPFNHTCAVSGGHMEDESAKLLRGFLQAASETDKIDRTTEDNDVKEKFYITTAIAYTSQKPHIGNVYEAVLDRRDRAL